MKRLLLIGLGLSLMVGAVAAHADESGPSRATAGAENAKGEKGEPSVSDVIFGHVSDEHEMEFQSPFGGEVKIELPRIPHAFGIEWLDLSITKHTVWMWVAAILVVLIFALGRPRSITPSGFGIVLETLVLFVRDEIAKPTIGDTDYKRYTPYLCSAFFFILVCNLLGVIPYTATPTGNISVTAGLALFTFIVTQAATIRVAGVGGWLAHLTGGVHWALWPIMIPIEIMGLFAKPFALALRLFANMIAGHIVIFYLLALIFIFRSVLIAPASVFLAVCIYMLEIFVALLQAYVFTMLSAVFIGLGVASGHHGHDEHSDQGEHEAKPAH